ncbi:MAG: hypothetical protein ABIJ14_02870 [Nanoarchaeota archaeon]
MTSRKPCPNRDENLKECPCDWPGCERKGACCECVAHHREAGNLPACLH